MGSKRRGEAFRRDGFQRLDAPNPAGAQKRQEFFSVQADKEDEYDKALKSQVDGID